VSNFFWFELCDSRLGVLVLIALAVNLQENL